MVNCDSCTHIDYTEQEQHERGLREVPGHRCMYYNKSVFHKDCHRGVIGYIFPCEQCENDNHEQYRERRKEHAKKDETQEVSKE